MHIQLVISLTPRLFAAISDLTPSQLYEMNQVSRPHIITTLTNDCPKSLYDDSIPVRPLIDEIVPMSVLRTEYENGSAAFVQQIDWLNANGFNSIRRTKGVHYFAVQRTSDLKSDAGDGDCFYRCEVGHGLSSFPCSHNIAVLSHSLRLCRTSSVRTGPRYCSSYRPIDP